MSTLDNFAMNNITNSVEEQLRRHFIDLREGNGWQVVKVYRIEDEKYKYLERYSNYYGTYAIETIALHDVNGPNKHGQYNKAAKDDLIRDIVVVLTDGHVIMESMELVSAEKRGKRESTALTVHGAKSLTYTGYTKIVCHGS